MKFVQSKEGKGKEKAVTGCKKPDVPHAWRD